MGEFQESMMQFDIDSTIAYVFKLKQIQKYFVTAITNLGASQIQIYVLYVWVILAHSLF